VLLGPLAAGWIEQHLDDDNEVALELLHRDIATLCHAILEIGNVQFVGRRGNGKGRSGPRDRSPLFPCLEFPGVEEAQAFGHLSDSTGLPAEFYSFWTTYFGERVEMWCCMVILEALSVVFSFDKWSSIMDLGQEKACPPSPAAL
jgi:hypothetical protein